MKISKIPGGARRLSGLQLIAIVVAVAFGLPLLLSFLMVNQNDYSNVHLEMQNIQPPSEKEQPASQEAAAAAAISSSTTTNNQNKKNSHHCINEDFQPKEKFSVWTMLNDNKAYVRGAVKLGRAVKKHTTTPIDLVVMELKHKPLTEDEWTDLKAVGWQKCTVTPIPAPQKTRFDLAEKFAVLHVWAMEVYERVVFLDADTFVQNKGVEELLHMDLQGKPLGVTQDIRAKKWVTTFNSGVMILEPTLQEHERLMKLLQSGMEFEYVMSDQGFLNAVYQNNWHEIGFLNNANLALYRFQRPFWDQHKLEDINIIHYTMQKPWKCSANGPYGPICKLWINGE